MTLALCAAPLSQAQDPATEQRLNELSGRIENLQEVIDAQRKQITELSRQLNELREKQNRPTPNYAVHDDLKRVAEFAEKVDKNRVEDNRKIHVELERLAKILSQPPPPPVNPPRPRITTPPPEDKDDPADKPTKASDKQDYLEHTVKKGDSLDAIVQAYRDQLKIKLTRAMVLKANPGLTPEKIIVGHKIKIPVPAAP